MSSKPLELLRSLNLPTHDYVILGSAPLFAHGLIPSLEHDVDVVARNAAWKAACSIMSSVRGAKGDLVVRLFDGMVEIFDGWSPMQWDIDEIIECADIIDGLPFARLEYVLEFKRVLNRPKDQVHIRLIEPYLQTISSNHIYTSMTTAHFLDQLDYTLWGNKRAIASLETLQQQNIAPPERAVQIMSHIVAAQHIWYARVAGKPDVALPVWGELSFAEMNERILSIHTAWVKYLKGKTDAELPSLSFSYKNSLGQEYTNTLLEIVTHFPIHSEHHRGQIALLVRQAGGTPVNTDYIQFAREEHKR